MSFVIDDVPVYADVQAALAKQTPAETGLVTMPRSSRGKRSSQRRR